MTSEIQKSKYLKCARCGGDVIRKNTGDPFFICDGRKILGFKITKHALYMVSSKFDTIEGSIPEGEFINWEEIDGKANFEKRAH